MLTGSALATRAGGLSRSGGGHDAATGELDLSDFADKTTKAPAFGQGLRALLDSFSSGGCAGACRALGNVITRSWSVRLENADM